MDQQRIIWLALGFFEKEKSLLLSKKESYVIVIQYIKKMSDWLRTEDRQLSNEIRLSER